MTASAEDVRERQLAIVLIDLARFTQVVAGLELQELASIVAESTGQPPRPSRGTGGVSSSSWETAASPCSNRRTS